MAVVVALLAGPEQDNTLMLAFTRITETLLAVACVGVVSLLTARPEAVARGDFAKLDQVLKLMAQHAAAVIRTPRGALTIDVKPAPPMCPRLEMVKQAPRMSSAESFLVRVFPPVRRFRQPVATSSFLSTSSITSTSRPSGVSTAKPMLTYFLRMIALPLGASEAVEQCLSLTVAAP